MKKKWLFISKSVCVIVIVCVLAYIGTRSQLVTTNAPHEVAEGKTDVTQRELTDSMRGDTADGTNGTNEIDRTNGTKGTNGTYEINEMIGTNGIAEMNGTNGLIGESLAEEVSEQIRRDLGDIETEISDGSIPLSGRTSLGATTELREYSLKVVQLVNIERKKEGATELTETDLLHNAASVRATELEKLFSHDRPDGRLCFSIYEDYNIKCGYRAENVAAGYESPESVVVAWMQSDGHCRNILNPAYSKIGVGVHMDSYGKFYWVQLFSD